MFYILWIWQHFLDNIGIRHLWTTHSLLPRPLATARLPTHQMWKTDHWPPLEPAEHCPWKQSICFDDLFHFWMFPFLVMPQQSICLDISYFLCLFSHTSCSKISSLKASINVSSYKYKLNELMHPKPPTCTVHLRILSSFISYCLQSHFLPYCLFYHTHNDL